jgi:aryl-alcohol dehydrogenase-like predicted oxidoreductase
MKRRDFLKTSAAAAAVVAVSPLKAKAESKKPTVQKYEEIGKTGLKMSDISFGTGGLPSASMVLRAVDRGMNYFDTAPDYGSAEDYIGEAMGKLQRDKIIIASKFCNYTSYPGHLPLGTPKKKYIESVEDSLARMKTDYMDFCFVHAIGEQSKEKDREVKRLLDEEMLSAVADLKKAGKVRFLAVSSHGPTNMEDLLMEAVRSGHYDMFMPSFNFMNFPRLPEVMKEAKKRGVGIVAMKTLAGAKDTDFDPKGEDFDTAAFKWVLNHEEVNGLVVTIKSVKNLDHYLAASGKKFTSADREVLDRYASRYGAEYCRTGCGRCEGSCPAGVPVATTLRYQMYFENYGQEKDSLAAYARLGGGAAGCLSCDVQSCVAACPYGLPVSASLRRAHRTLSFDV